MLTLYRGHNAVCCHKVELALFEKGLEFESRTVPLFRSAQFEPAYLKINPRGVVPTLVHDGRTIIESTVICEYLDETFPDRPLMPEPQNSHDFLPIAIVRPFCPYRAGLRYPFSLACAVRTASTP